MDNTVEVQELGKVMITPKGEYSLSKSYEILDAVSYNGSSYVSKINDNTSVPTSDDWQLLAQKGDIYDVTEEDLQAIAKQITDNANSAFNQNVKAKTDEFDTNTKNKTADYDTNAKTKLKEYNENDTKKLKAYNDNADNKLSAYNTNDANKLKAYNTNADSKIEEYNTNANSKILEYDKHSEELRNMAISTDNELERVKNEVLDTGSASDSFIRLEDSAMAELQELEIEGVCRQETTQGMNLYNFKDVQINDASITVDKDGWFNIMYDNTKGTNVVYKNFFSKNLNLEADTTYTIVAEIKKISVSGSGSSLVITSINGNQGQFSSLTKYLLTTLSNNTIEISKVSTRENLANVNSGLRSFLSITAGEKVDITLRLSVLKDTTIAEKTFNYEPYTGGQPSPSPDYPQEIKTITNNLKIMSCGRNLLKNIATSATVNGVSFTVNDDGSVLANGTATADAVFKILPIATTFSQNLILSPNKTYTLSDSVGNYTDYFTQVVIQDANGNKNWYNTTGDIDISTNVIACLYTAQIYVRKDKTVNNVLFKPQLVVKDSANLFEAYIENQIQANLPDEEFIGKINDTYKDTLNVVYNEDDAQYHLVLQKMIKKYIFTGNENWSTYTQSNGIPIYRCTLPAIKFFLVISNYFASQTVWPTVLLENKIFNHVGNYQNLEIACSKFNTLTDFKKFLTANDVQMYYALATPYTLDLGIIDMPLSYNEITNILTDSELMPNINAKYYRNFKKTVQNLQVNNKALKDELNDINNRLTALENAKTTVSEELNNESEANVNDIQE